MYIRRPPSDLRREGSNGAFTDRSLAFLHKPQRVTQPRALYADEWLRRNTDMNRGNVKVENCPEDYFSQNFKGDGPTKQTAASEANGFDPSASNASAGDTASPLRVNPYFPAEEDSVVADAAAPPLVRKKSGEVVRPSLKMAQRSRSLPATPSDREPDKRLGGPPAAGPKRSKSVHFDQRDVVKFKYFWQEDSPLDVAEQDVLEGPLDDQRAKTVVGPTSMARDLTVDDDDDGNDDRAVQRDLTMSLSNLTFERRMSNTSGGGLRRSRRYQKLKAQGATPPTRPGLYHANFATLADDDQCSLKSNIFLNIAHNSSCFLQELSLIGDQHYLVGHVLVKNVYYEKTVLVRYTRDSWRTSRDIECVWASSGDDVLPGMHMDRFKLVIDLAGLQEGDTSRDSTPSHDSAGHACQLSTVRLQFCIQYVSRDANSRVEYWDNNAGRNYVVDVVSSAPRMGFTNPFDAAS